MKIQNSKGLSIDFINSGLIKSIVADPIRISSKVASEFSQFGANIYLRKKSSIIDFIALTGPKSNSEFTIKDDKYLAKGEWNGLQYNCSLNLSPKSPSWKWSIEIINKSDEEVELDLIYVQDVGLKTISNSLVNEYYISQYIERLILNHENYGAVVCCRQNARESNDHPWLVVACPNGAQTASTDGMQLYGKTFRETGIPEGLLADKLGGEYAGESSVIAIQEKPFKLGSGGEHRSSFVASYMSNHPKATSSDDLKTLAHIFSEFDVVHSKNDEDKNWLSPEKNLFNTSSFLPVDDLREMEVTQYFGAERRHEEKSNGELLSFFSNNNHIVLRSKEILVDRPHGHIIQTNLNLTPSESIMSTNTFAYGVFNSHLTQGNTNFNVFLSICSNQFNTATETGQRIFVNIKGQYYLLGIPSAFEMGLNHCRWIYKFGDQVFQIRTWTSKATSQINLDFKVLNGSDVDIIITHHLDELNGWKIKSGSSPVEFIAKPKADSMIAGKFPSAQFRIAIQSNESDFKPYFDIEQNGLFTIDVKKTSAFCMSFLGEVCAPTQLILISNSHKQWQSDCDEAHLSWKNLSLNLDLIGKQNDVAAIREIIPWFGLNALIHYLTPYGLEQFGGAAWGTRDVSQGPIDLLLNLGKYDEAKEILKIIFSNQNPDGGWPQWWMFDSYTNIRANEAHGDIIYWCLLGLCSYIKVSGDFDILNQELPYFSENGNSTSEKTPLSEHVDRLIKMIIESFIPGTALVPFGGGDWNDSLQPVSEELAQKMISSWTVEMNYQAFMQLQHVYELTGNTEKAKELKDICHRIKSDFNKHLIKNGVVAGYGIVESNDAISVLLHPSDTKTNISYSVLPMNRGIISGIFSMEQADAHQNLVEKHLKGPDGVRLMDRPMRYKGGVQEIFQRAESSTYFGREIGLMYVHEHIRYAESLAIMGKGEVFIKALRQAIPVDYSSIVPCGDVRQSNCYYSSSDVVFKSRYDADERYEEVKDGSITLHGGWRVYSSGPGIYIGLVISRLIGLRVEYDKVVIDPVMPKSFDGLAAKIKFLGKNLELTYNVKGNGYSPTSIIINGKQIVFTLEENQYRRGGAVISKDLFLSQLDMATNEIIINI
ncbi:MAG: hypothetical protein RBR68_14810 [Tenuifilaceae bacterium]|nr:hypothetical protein [Tenuifilaceae bacterium]